MSLSAIYWIIAAPYILIVGGALLIAAFCGALVSLDQLFIQPVANCIDKILAPLRQRP